MSGKPGKSIHSFLVAQAEYSADFLTHPVRVLTDFWIDQFGVDLRGDDGLVPEDFLQVSSGMPLLRVRVAKV